LRHAWFKPGHLTQLCSVIQLAIPGYKTIPEPRNHEKYSRKHVSLSLPFEQSIERHAFVVMHLIDNSAKLGRAQTKDKEEKLQARIASLFRCPCPCIVTTWQTTWEHEHRAQSTEHDPRGVTVPQTPAIRHDRDCDGRCALAMWNVQWQLMMKTRIALVFLTRPALFPGWPRIDLSARLLGHGHGFTTLRLNSIIFAKSGCKRVNRTRKPRKQPGYSSKLALQSALSSVFKWESWLVGAKPRQPRQASNRGLLLEPIPDKPSSIQLQPLSGPVNMRTSMAALGQASGQSLREWDAGAHSKSEFVIIIIKKKKKKKK
jgi:hypothetical protein